MPDTLERRFNFDGVRNFRDFGGYAARKGRMASGRFFRSAHHASASEHDLERLAAMDIEAVIDLRRPNERAAAPSRRWKDFRSRLVESDDPYEGEESWEAFLSRWDLTPEGFREFQNFYYRRTPFLPRFIDLFRRYLETLATATGPVIVHCAAGKDRTGLVVALTHAMAGVHRDDIVGDYLLSNDPDWLAVRAPYLAKEIGARHGRAPGPEAMHVALLADARYIETAFSEIENRHGSIERYFCDALELDEPRRSAIESRLLE